jgi:hypothetical protein
VSTYVYLILSFARPEKLISCIRSINLNDPSIPIYLCVDICEDEHSPFYDANQKLITLGENLVLTGGLAGFTFTPSNLKTKAAANFALKWAFKFSENVVFMEDDLNLEIDPHSFILDAIDRMANPMIGMSTLYTRSSHKQIAAGQSIDFRLTRWPIMWGFILSKNNYVKITKNLSGWSDSDYFDLAKNYIDNSSSSKLTKLFRNRFTSSWVFKYRNAHKSKTAWDTEWQSGLWKLNLLTLVPIHSFLRDTGVDESSVSQNKSSWDAVFCPGDWEIPMSNHFICNRCERVREHENRTIPHFLTKVPFLGRCIDLGLL